MRKILILTVFAFNFVFGQKAELFLNDSSILLGEPVFLTLRVISTNEKVVLPIFIDSIVSKVELLKVDKIDTSSNENGWIFTQKFTITSFDSGTYILPKQKILIGDLTVYTNSLSLNVNTIKVDLAKNIKDIAPILDQPLTLKEILKIVLKWSIIIVAILLIMYIVNKFYLKYKNSKIIPEIEVKQRPFMEVFWEKLKELEGANYWQKGNVKEHHSKATELMRSYLEYRFNINALENTTSNILVQLRGMQIDKMVYEKIKQSLLFADMVKFAKVQGIKEQHEKVISNLKELVSETNSNREVEK